MLLIYSAIVTEIYGYDIGVQLPLMEQNIFILN